MRFVLFLLVVLLALASPAAAKTWTIDYDHSFIGFTAHQGENALKMRFTKYTIKADFEPSNPQAGKISADIDIPSILSNTDEVKSNLPNAEWLDYKMFPKAIYVTTYIEPDAEPNCYKATGMLLLKGVSKETGLHFCMAQEGDHMRIKGDATVMRNDFKVGTGHWSEDDMVGYPVEISMDIVAR